MDVVQERLEREYNLDLIATAPSVIYHVYLSSGEMLQIDNPAKMPDASRIDHIEEPYVKASLMVPNEFIGAVMQLCQDKRGIYKSMDVIDGGRNQIVYEIPLSEIIYDFFDKLKSCTKGYASLDYEIIGYREEDLVRMDILLNAALCVNGDYYGNSDEGVVVRNGVIYRANPTDADILCLYYDGTMEVKAYRDFDAQAEADQGIWQAWTFGPSLLNSDGSAVSGFNEGRHMNGDNPRTVLGYYAPGHYAVLVVDGRGESAGLSLDELAGLCEELGFTIAYNLDGGKSSVMTFNDALVNQPASGGRAISDVIYIAEALI